MFDGRAFQSWPRITLGGLWFGALFALVMLLADALTSSSGFHLSRRVVVFGGGAFLGYVGVAWVVRLTSSRRSD